MKVKILGGGREVGRSCFLVDAENKILLDSGIKLLTKGSEFPQKVKTNLDAIIISHAHLDHSGYLPALFTQGNAMVYMTQATLDLSELLWRDSIKIARLEGERCPYSSHEVKRVERFTFPIPFRKKIQITEKTLMEFFDSGHILGGAITKLWFGKKSLVYSGDYKIEETRLFKGADTRIGETNYLIIESTYGDRNHPNRRKTEKEFVEAVIETTENGGTALVPAFAVGRSQEILDILYEYKVKAPIFFDGMGQKSARIHLQYPELLKDPKFLGKALHSINWVKRNRKKALREPSIIVTSAGMLQGGPAMFYLPKIFNDSRSKILLTGYQVEGTPGRILLEKGWIDLNGEKVKVKAEVKKFDFSAHASQDELFELIRKLNPEKVVCIHGDSEVIDFFLEEVNSMGFNAVGPRNGETIELE